MPENTIRHLDHSSFLVQCDGIVMVFDYFRDPGTISAVDGLHSGVIHPGVLAAEEVYVFVSHSHPDHFHPVIFQWQRHVPAIRYIISHDLSKPPVPATRLRPGEEKSVGKIRVRAYAASDAGLAYSIYTGGRHIYFAGDNAFWNWDGDLDDAVYLRTALADIDRQTPMDIAFQVCDPRLDGMGDGGIHIFARTFQPKLLVPIHAFGRYEFNSVAEKRLRAGGFANAYWRVRHKGELYLIA